MPGPPGSSSRFRATLESAFQCLLFFCEETVTDVKPGRCGDQIAALGIWKEFATYHIR